MENKYDHIRQAIEFTDIVKCTLGPRGMNIMLVDDSNRKVMTNDGATIMKTLKGGHPIMDLFKDLARSQEVAVGDGTTSSMIISGALLSNALQLIEKGIHPTIIIKGYDLAKSKAIEILENLKVDGTKKEIINTAFGSKIPVDIKKHLVSLILEIEDFQNLKLIKLINGDSLDSELYRGLVFEGVTLNDRMPIKSDGKIAVLDFQTNLSTDNFTVNSAEEMMNVENARKDHIKKIADELKKLNVKCVIYTDTNPDLENYFTEYGIMGIVDNQRCNIDNVCNATGAHAAPSLEFVKKSLGNAKVKYKKGKADTKGMVYIEGFFETLIIKGPTSQTLDEIERSIEDVVGLMKNSLDVVIGAGAIEIEISKEVLKYAKTVGGKEQLAIEKFADAIESIPLILAQNCGLDAIEILTKLKSEHEDHFEKLGVDDSAEKGYSNAKIRGILEPVAVKKHEINSATNVCNLILKTDKMLLGEEDKK